MVTYLQRMMRYSTYCMSGSISLIREVAQFTRSRGIAANPSQDTLPRSGPSACLGWPFRSGQKLCNAVGWMPNPIPAFSMKSEILFMPREQQGAAAFVGLLLSA